MTTSSMSLYQVGVEGLELQEILEANDGELTPELEDRLDAFLRAGHNKVDAACMVVKGKEALAKACAEEAKRFTERAAMFEADAKRLKSRILGAVDAAFDGKVKTAMFTVWGQTSAPTVSFEVSADVDLEALSDYFPGMVRKKFELDKTTLKKMRDEGVALPAAVSVTENEGTRFLRIK